MAIGALERNDRITNKFNDLDNIFTSAKYSKQIPEYILNKSGPNCWFINKLKQTGVIGLYACGNQQTTQTDEHKQKRLN